MTAHPTNVALIAHAVRKFETSDGQEKGAWTRIGIAFPHSKDGFNLKLELLPLNGQDIVLMPRDDDRELAPVHETRLIVYGVQHIERTGEDFWTRLGAAFPNSKGGYNLKLELLPLAGQNIVLMPPRKEEPA